MLHETDQKVKKLSHFSVAAIPGKLT